MYNRWAEYLTTRALKIYTLQSETGFYLSPYKFENLYEIFAFKFDSKNSTKLQIGIVSNLTYSDNKFYQMEILIERQNTKNQFLLSDSFVVDQNTNHLFKLVSIDYGIGLDLKEEMFRDFSSILHLV